MKMILAAMFAVMVGLTFIGSTFAADAPATAPAAGGEMKKDEGMKAEKKEKKAKKAKKEKKEEKKEEKK